MVELRRRKSFLATEDTLFARDCMGDTISGSPVPASLIDMLTVLGSGAGTVLARGSGLGDGDDHWGDDGAGEAENSCPLRVEGFLVSV